MFTRKGHPLVALVIVVCLTLCFPLLAKADAAPPQAPPGSSIATNDFETRVQMVSEAVVIDVQTYHGPPVSFIEDEEVEEENRFPINRLLREGDLMGHVTASFTMKNQGDEPESFDVWFPIGINNGYGEVATVVNFQAWVNGSLVETDRRRTLDEYETSVPWATWPVDFPVDEPVQLAVAYNLPPTSEHPQLRFDYILETGSGWWGAIETGIFTFRLPYEISAQNVSLRTRNLGYIPIDSLAVSGDEMRWEFSNLEPDQGDNIALRVISPSVWEEILLARAGVDASPGSAEAHLRLAHALRAAMGFKYGIVSGNVFVPEAIQAYEDALELAPDDIDIYVDYIELLFSLPLPTAPLHSKFEPTLMRALEVAPDDERLLEFVRWLRRTEREYEQEQAHYALQTALPLTQTAASEKTPTPPVTLTPTPPASTPTLTATADAPPQPPQESGGFPTWVVIVGSGVLLFGLAAALRGRDGGARQ